MVKPIIISHKLSISLDLNNIVPYHPASGVFLQNKTTVPFSKSVHVNILSENIEGAIVEHANYKYREIINEILGNDLHTDNLLVLLQNLIEIEGAHYRSYIVVDQNEKPTFNLHLEIVQILKDLTVINSMIELMDLGNVQNTLKIRDNGIDVQGMKVEITGPVEKLEILQLIKKNRIRLLLDLPYPTLLYFKVTEDLQTPDLNSIKSYEFQDVIYNLEQPFKDHGDEPQKLFVKLVISTLSEYLKGEITWEHPSEFTDEEGVIIHTLLSIFNLIDHEISALHTDKRIKAEYIRSLKRKRGNKVIEKYTMIKDIPLDRISDYPDLNL